MSSDDLKGDVSEKIDINLESSELKTFGDGELTAIDERQRIIFRWLKERVVIWVAALTILVVLIASVLSLFFSSDPTDKDWAQQSLTALLGFAAGALFTSSQTRE